MKGLFKLFTLGLLPLLAQAQIKVEEIEEEIDNPTTSPRLQVSISTQFPKSEVFGVKLINGHATEAVLSVTNNETFPVSLRFIGGSLWTPAHDGQEARNVRNLTTSSYRTNVPAGSGESFTYTFTTDLHPADLQLQIAAVLADDKGTVYTVPAFNGTVSVVEAPTSFFDPQIIFLYLVLGALFAGTSYFIYNTWITTLFPQQKRRVSGKGGERAKASSGGSKKVEPVEQHNVVGADGPAVASGKGYDESWIPAHHIQRPQAKRVRSGGPGGGVKSKARPAA